MTHLSLNTVCFVSYHVQGVCNSLKSRTASLKYLLKSQIPADFEI